MPVLLCVAIGWPRWINRSYDGSASARGMTCALHGTCRLQLQIAVWPLTQIVGRTSGLLARCMLRRPRGSPRWLSQAGSMYDNDTSLGAAFVPPNMPARSDCTLPDFASSATKLVLPRDISSFARPVYADPIAHTGHGAPQVPEQRSNAKGRSLRK